MNLKVTESILWAFYLLFSLYFFFFNKKDLDLRIVLNEIKCFKKYPSSTRELAQ